MSIKAKFGHMNCEGCAADGKVTRVLVRKNDRNTLSAQCDECDTTEHAQEGTGKHARWSKKITPLDAPAAAPAAAAKEAPKPAAKVPGKYGDKYAV